MLTGNVEKKNNRHAILERLAYTISRESHILLQHPELFWQQFHNRLQWEDQEISVILENAEQKKKEPEIWLKTIYRNQESQDLIRTLQGHNDEVKICQIHPNGHLFASAADDGNIILWNALNGEQLSILKGHTSKIFSMIFAADGEQIISGGEDGTVRIWDISTGQQKALLEGHTGEVRAIACSPDGERLITCGRDRKILLWRLPAGILENTFQGHQNLISCCAFHPDGQTFVTGSWDETLRIWNIQSGERQFLLYGHSRNIHACAYTPDGRKLISASGDGLVGIWDPSSGKTVEVLEGHTEPVIALAISPDGKWCVSGSWDNTLIIWDIEQGAMLHTLTGHKAWINCCTISPDGKMVISGSMDDTIKAWDPGSGALLTTMEGHSNCIEDIAISPDGKSILSASIDHTLKVWKSTHSLQIIGERPSAESRKKIESIVFSHDESWFAAACDDNTLRLVENDTGNECLILEGHTNIVVDCALNASSRWLVSASWDNTLKCWSVDSGELRFTMQGHEFHVESCAIGPQDAWILSSSKDSTIRIWDPANGNELQVLQGNRYGRAIYDLSSSKQRLALVKNRTHLHILDTRTWQTIKTIEDHDEAITSCRFHPSGKLVTATCKDHTTSLWDISSGKLIRQYIDESGFVFSPDGRFLVSSGRNNSIQFHDLHTSTDYPSQKNHSDFIYNKQISPDGKWVFSTSADRCIRVWNVVNGKQEALLPLSGRITALALSRFKPFLVCGDNAGNLFNVECMGLEYDPLIVSARSGGSRPTIHCPYCSSITEINSNQMGKEVKCSNPKCSRLLYVNSLFADDLPSLI